MTVSSLIVRSGTWNPEADEQHHEYKDGLAARGYPLAYQAVLKSLNRILTGENPGLAADARSAATGIARCSRRVLRRPISASDLAGYRNPQVYPRGSMHIPLNCDAVCGAMPVFFELPSEETKPAVRVVLGHPSSATSIPYMDGNGRTVRFLMNVMLADRHIARPSCSHFPIYSSDTALNLVAAFGGESNRSIRFFSKGSTPAAISFRGSAPHSRASFSATSG